VERKVSRAADECMIMLSGRPWVPGIPAVTAGYPGLGVA
jgi:hypothetical protein